MPTWEQLQARVSYSLVRPSWVVRPAPAPPISSANDDEDDDESGTEDECEGRPKKTPTYPPLRKDVMLPVFSKLPKKDLLIAMQVCRQWAEWTIEPSLWKNLSLAHSIIDITRLHGIVRRQPASLVLDWSKISYEQFSWLLCRLPQLKSLHCEGLSWGVLRPLVSPYCPSLSKLNISFCEGVDDDTLSSLLRPPPFNRPGYRNTTSRLRQLICLKLAGTQVGDNSVGLIARSLPFLTHLDLSWCLRLSNHTPELLAHSTSVVSHSLTSLDLRGCHRMTPLVLPSLVRLPILSRLALDPCDYIPFKAIEVWGKSNGYSFGEERIMTRAPPVSNPMEIDGVSDCETEVTSTLIKPQSTVDDKEDKRDIEVSSKCHNSEPDKERLSDKGSRKNQGYKINEEDNSTKLKDTKESTECNKSDVGDWKKMERKESNRLTKSGNQKEISQLKCIITPLIKKNKGSDSQIESKDERCLNPDRSAVETKKEERPNLSSAEEVTQVSSEVKPSESCRRSERSNKGRKYKLNFAKKRTVREKLKRRETFRKGDKVSLKEDEGKTVKKEGPRTGALQSQSFRKKHLKKSFTCDFKRKVRKNIMTRSKKQKHETEARRSKPQYEVVHRTLLKPSKEGSKESHAQGTKTFEPADDSLKVRITLKGGPQYASKLRKKSRDDDSSSPTSSPEGKCLTSQDPKKKQDDTPTSFTKKVKDQTSQRSSEEIPSSSSLVKRRKERRGSSSSSSSSPSSSPCLPLSKKLKVEIEPITKISRRRSDLQKPSNASGNSSKEALSAGNSSTGANSSSLERSSNRDRPERHHRSPRRLSMCQ